MEPIRSLLDAEREIIATTERDLEEVCTLWRDGVAMLGANLASVRSWPDQVKRDHAMLGLLAHAANTQLCAYKLATSGYTVQAQALMRICDEEDAAFIYLWGHPEEAERFLDTNLEAPRWQEIRDGVKSALGARGEETARALQEGMNWLHKLTHVDSRSVRGSYEVRPGSSDDPTMTAHFGIGPRYDAEDFELCAGQFMVILRSLLYHSIAMCQLVSASPAWPTAHTEFGARLDGLMNRRFGHTSTGWDTPQ